MGSNKEKIDQWFTYHSPDADQVMRMQRIRGKAKELAELIDMFCPDGADKMAALRHLRIASHTANASIVCDE